MNNSVECSQKKSAKLSKLKFIMWIYYVNGLLIYELMCNEKLRTSSVVHPMLVKQLVIFDFAIAKF
jgi:glucan phosphoethanolaminetransferase (alkaline phosphatase superfamily)